MSEESTFCLRALHAELETLGADIVGPLELREDLLATYNGQMLLQAGVRNDPGYHASIAHCHVIARIGRTSWSDPLDACVMGIDVDRRKGIAKAAQNWVKNVGSVLFSLLHAKPMMDASHFSGQDPWGVPGCHGFVGPLFGYNLAKPEDLSPLLNAGLFDYASAMAPPGVIHLAKVVLEAKGADGWNRTTEIDGHLASFAEKRWDWGIAAPAQGIMSQFAVFHYADQKDAIEARRRLDDAIRQFVSEVALTKDVEEAARRLGAGGVEADVIHRVAAFVPLAFCRVIFGGIGAKFSSEFVRIRTNGTSESLKLMREPAFARSAALCHELAAGGLVDAVKWLAMTSSTFHAINKLLNAGSKPENLATSAVVIPDPGVDPAAIERAIKQVRPPSAAPKIQMQPAKKKWWRF